MTDPRPTGKPKLPSLAVRLRIAFASGLPKMTRYVLVHLCYRVNKETWETWVGEEKMAEETDMGLTTVKKGIKQLEREGWIERYQGPKRTKFTRLRLEAFHSPNAVLHSPESEGPPDDSSESRAAAAGGSPGDSQTVAARPQSGSLSVFRSVSKSSVDDVDPSRLFDELKAKGLVGERQQFDWAVSVIRERASTPPASAEYWRKSLPRFFKNFSREVLDFLTRRAAELHREGLRDTNLKDKLAWEAAAHGLPYAPLLQEALEKAEARIEAENQTARALRIGTGPTHAA